MFSGAFNKKNNFCEREFARKKFGIEYAVNSALFGSVAAEIVSTIGDKNKYTVQDAYAYFHMRYRAYQIDYRQFYNYCHTGSAKIFDVSRATVTDDADIELLAEESGKYFSYLAGGRLTDESALTLVIDSGVVRELCGTTADDNLILVIGTFDGVTINSMKVIFTPNIPEIEYALEFFRLHS